ncbi:hypothetical protein PHMEG_00019982 [Phytophthora megakarya]|uniref:Uncharacterized protein n=1 Tax=Phytophthora megakarya TaxID=4795 RepID=A0A225VR46_9STRA|nr:hypothetical protein PHMEG_00019982 [Phytophthora megakarya]
MPGQFKFPQVEALTKLKMFSERSGIGRQIAAEVEDTDDVEMQRPKNQEQADRLYYLGIASVPLKLELCDVLR